MDIWEANSMAEAYTPHPCTSTGQTRCTGSDCGVDARYDSLCDADGCDLNSWRMGDQTFLGPGASFKVDTTKKITVVTQFITDTGTATGTLSEIRRIYVQNGAVIYNAPVTNVPGYTGNSITADYCDKAKTAFGDRNVFKEKGGLPGMSAALKNGMVLVSSSSLHQFNQL